MPSLSIQSSVSYAKTLLPETLTRSVSTVQATIQRHILPSAEPRRFKVCTPSRRRRRELVAASLDELLQQTVRVFPLSCKVLTLVLEDDGTVVDSESFFQSLPQNTSLMVLDKDEMWTQSGICPSLRKPKRNGIATLTFDLYKLHPKDFLGCLSVKATLYEAYTLSYDLRCTGAKQVLKSSLRCLTYSTRLAAQLLLYASSSVLQLVGNDEN